MFSIIRFLIDRFKAIFMARALIELEADLITLAAERKAELLRRADQFEKEGLDAVAHQMRQQAETLQCDAPLASSHVVIAHLRSEPPESLRATDTIPIPSTAEGPTGREPSPIRKKKT